MILPEGQSYWWMMIVPRWKGESGPDDTPIWCSTNFDPKWMMSSERSYDTGRYHTRYGGGTYERRTNTEVRKAEPLDSKTRITGFNNLLVS